MGGVSPGRYVAGRVQAEPAILSVCGLLAYDGTEYHGFQLQDDVPTIQGPLEAALAQCAMAHSRVVGAGRTDTGVHSNGQVVAVQVSWRHTVVKLQDAWNFHLPPDLMLRRLCQAPTGFHPRFSALWRTYRYTVIADVAQGAAPRVRKSPLTNRYAWFLPRYLDIATMNEAAALLIGKHDFATFGQPTQGESTVRVIRDAIWQVETSSLPSLQQVDDHFPGQRLVLTVTANGFLRNMVRCLVGSMVAVGLGEWSLQTMSAALAAQDRSRTAPPAPPHGLVLERVEYPPELDPWQMGS